MKLSCQQVYGKIQTQRKKNDKKKPPPVFELLVEKTLRKEDMFQYPIVTFSLISANPNGSLWQEKNKVNLRN